MGGARSGLPKCRDKESLVQMAGGTSIETGPSQYKSALQHHSKRERAASGTIEASSHSNKDLQVIFQLPAVPEELDYEPTKWAAEGHIR